MKKRFFALIPALLLSLLLSLAGCSSPSNALLGSVQKDAHALPVPDADEKIYLGRHVRAPFKSGEFVLNETNEALAASGFFYATWTTGEPVDFTNSNGENAKLYDAQIYAVVYEAPSSEDADMKAIGWAEAARQRYEISSEQTLPIGDHGCAFLEYLTPAETTPFEGGASAFFSVGSTAVCAELQYAPGWIGDPAESLKDFLKELCEP